MNYFSQELARLIANPYNIKNIFTLKLTSTTQKRTVFSTRHGFHDYLKTILARKSPIVSLDFP